LNLLPPGGRFNPNILHTLSDDDLRDERDESRVHDLRNPLDSFELFITPEVLESIVLYTNQSAAQYLLKHLANQESHMKQWEPVTRIELKAYLAITLHLGINSCPELPIYWSRDESFRIPGITRVMPRDRFFAIQQFIYFNDLKEGKEGTDSLRKLRSVFDSISQSSQDLWLPRAKLVIDESMVAFSGEHAGAVYLPRKPVKNGPC